MKISVVTVCFNSAATIADTVRSFLDQRYDAKELVVVDGCSTDGTLDVVRSFDDPNIRVISEPDRGIYDAMNKGLAVYSGDAVGFLNSDDRFHDDTALERIAAALDTSDAVYGDIVVVADHREKRPLRIWKAGDFKPGSFRRGWMPPHPTFYVNRALADTVGGFDLRFSFAADYDYMLRALELRQPRVTYLRHTLVDFLHGGHSTKGIWRYVHGNYESLLSRRRHLGAPFIDLALVLKPLRKLHQFRRS
jgi:glycosyltransferase